MNSATAVATFSGRRESWRCARGRTSSRQRRPASVTRLRYGGTGERIGAGTPPRQCPARARPRERPRLWRHDVQQHHAATLPSTPPTPARPSAASPQRRPGLPGDGQAAPQLPARGQPPLRRRLPPDPRTRRSASLPHHQICTTYRMARRRPPSGVRLGDARLHSSLAKRQHLAAWGWPYSGPRAARTSGVNAGESLGPGRASCRARQQVRGSVVLASKGRSGTLTRKRSLVQIQYGPPGISCSWPYKVALCGPTTALRRALQLPGSGH